MIAMAESFKKLLSRRTGAERNHHGKYLEITAYGVSSISVGDLNLDATDAGANKTVEFTSGSNINFRKRSLTGNLNTPKIAVTGLTFTQITTAKKSGQDILYC